MQANIETRNAPKNALGVVSEAPWQGLGQDLKRGATIDVWQKQAGMDWDIIEEPVRFRVGRRHEVFEGQKVLYRSDTEQPLSIVSADYKVVQPREVLEFFRDLVRAHDMTVSTAGTLFNGTKYWALADTGRDIVVNDNDLIRGMLLLTTSCDGMMATTATFTSVRVVCNNTLHLATHNDVKDRIRLTHRADLDDDVVKRQLGTFDREWESFEDQMNRLSRARVKEHYAKEFVFELFSKPRLKHEDQPYTVLRDTESVLNRYRDGMGTRRTVGTLFGLVNAVTEFIDHESRNRVPDNLLWNSWFGKGSQIKSKAFAKALSLV